MRTSIINGAPMPESAAEFDGLLTQGSLRYTNCVDCRKTFSTTNVQTADGWVETQISGTCETCWDAMFAEGDDDEHEGDEESESLKDRQEREAADWQDHWDAIRKGEIEDPHCPRADTEAQED